MHLLLKSWLSEIESSQLLRDGKILDVANGNLFCFSMSMKDAKSMNAEEIDEFLFAACHCYALKLTDAPQTMWFYAWHDELAGQLRTSAAPVNCSGELPFGCRLNVVKFPTPVSVSILNSDYLDGIPMPELDERSPEGDILEDEDVYELTVFAQRLPLSV